MEQQILHIDLDAKPSDIVLQHWKQQDIGTECLPTMEDALERMLRQEYLFVTINADTVEYMRLLKLMREMKLMPILVLTSQYDETEMVEALRRGADMYMRRPASAEGQMAVQQSLLRRCTEYSREPPLPITTLVYEDILMSVEYREVAIDGKPVELSRVEFDLLHLFLSNPGRIFTTEQMYAYMYGDLEKNLANNVVNAMRSHIKRLRDKLVGSIAVKNIEAVREIGYRIKRIKL